MNSVIILLLLIGSLIGIGLTAEKNYTDIVKLLQSKIQEPEFKGSAYKRLAYITDTYGTRLWGSISL